MITALPLKDLRGQLEERFPSGIVTIENDSLVVIPENLITIMSWLKDTTRLEFDYLNFVTAVDYYRYFEVVYMLTSTKREHTITVRCRIHDRETPAIPSVMGLWQGADFQEREIFDLLGITFEDRPDMKRIFLWDGFEGYPLRKDFNR